MTTKSPSSDADRCPARNAARDRLRARRSGDRLRAPGPTLVARLRSDADLRRGGTRRGARTSLATAAGHVHRPRNCVRRWRRRHASGRALRVGVVGGAAAPGAPRWSSTATGGCTCTATSTMSAASLGACCAHRRRRSRWRRTRSRCCATNSTRVSARPMNGAPADGTEPDWREARRRVEAARAADGHQQRPGTKTTTVVALLAHCSRWTRHAASHSPRPPARPRLV